MKDRVLTDIGAKEPLQDWTSVDWKKVKKRVRNLRRRIYQATQNGQWNKVRSLKKLMVKCVTFHGCRRLEPDEGRPSSPVLRGGGSGDVCPLTRPAT